MEKVVIGNAELWHGDCREVLPLLPPCQCVVTSPPYNTLAGIPAKTTGSWAAGDGGGSWIGALSNNGYADDLPEHEYVAAQNLIFSMVNAAPNASLFYNHQIRWRDGVVSHPVEWFKPSGWNLRQEIIWDRGGGMMFNARMFCRFDERVLWFVRDAWQWNQDFVGFGTIWRINKAQNKEHPVAYPVELPMRCIGATTQPGDLVLDPFSGSASTGIAAMTLGRRFVGIERERKYFDIACERISRAQAQGFLLPPDEPAPEQLRLDTE